MFVYFEMVMFAFFVEFLKILESNFFVPHVCGRIAYLG